MAKNPQQVAQKWAGNLGGATTAIQNGVNAVTVAPTQKAAAQAAAYVAGVQQAVNSGKWQAGLNGVSLQVWQTAMVTKGIPRIATGAQAAVNKFQTFMTSLLQYQQAGLSQLPPRGDRNQNKARMNAWSDYMANFRKPVGT